MPSGRIPNAALVRAAALFDRRDGTGPCAAMSTARISMLDFLYILGTLAFFGLMLGYVSFCARIGKADEANAGVQETRS